MEEKNKAISNKKIILIIVLCLLAIITIFLVLYFLNNKTKNLNNQNENDMPPVITDNDNKPKEGKYIANSTKDFIDYLNKIECKSSETYEVIYDKTKIIISLTDKYLLNVYYNENELNIYELTDDNYLINDSKFYLLKDNENEGLVVVSEIGPVASNSKYLVFAIDLQGNVLMSEKIIPMIGTEITIKDNLIEYKYETKMQEEFNLSVKAENENDFCKYLKDNYNDDYVVTGTKKYQFTDGKISLISDEKNTIKTYKEKYNCN